MILKRAFRALALIACSWRGHKPFILNRVRTCARCHLTIGDR